MERSPRTSAHLWWSERVKLAIGYLLIVVLFLWMNPQIPQRLISISSFPRQAIYAVLSINALVALLACAYATRFWAILGLVFFSLNLLVGTAFFRIKDRAITLMDAQSLLEAFGNTGDAMSQYRQLVLITCLQIILLLAVLLWVRRLIAKRSSTHLLSCSLTMTCLYVAILWTGGDTALVGFPNNFSPGMYAGTLAADAAIRHLASSGGMSEPFDNIPATQAVRHVVLVIDESIEGSIFSPMVEDAHLPNIKNFGVCYSYANGSAASNLMLRRGADPRDVGNSVRQFPSFFQSAKQSGFRTFYIDCQGVLNDHAVQDYFDEKEKTFIDEIASSRTLGRDYDRDLTAVQVLLEHLEQRGKTFTIVNKVGTHFPYRECLPTELANIQDPYRVSITRTSLGFISALAPKLPAGSMLFYTSDHGQNFTGKAPHGNLPGECVISEWTVPMIVLYSPDLTGIVEKMNIQWQNRGSHAVLTETIRNIMGSKNPGADSLWNPPSPEEISQHRAFFGSPMGLFGKPIPYLVIDKARRNFRSESAQP